jgi:tetratricopeptide (TPR) repeat protein
MRSLTPEQNAALEERKRISVKRLENTLYQPTAEELVRLANLERLADEPERGLEILQRLQARLKKRNETLSASGYNILGLCYGRLARRDLSYEHYRQAAEMEPGNSTYATNCGYALIHLGRPEEAIPLLKLAVTADPEKGDTYVILGDALRHAGREEEAIKEFREGKRRLEIQLRAWPHDTHLLDWAEGVCQRLGDYEEMKTLSRRKQESVRNAYLGVSTDELVAGMDSGIIRSGELSE